MRIIANLTYPHKGEILLDGKTYKQIHNVKKYLSFVSGETQVYDRLTPTEILTLFGEFAGLKKKELEEKIEYIAEKLEMKDFMNDICTGFSTGMKQKVS